jgi:hypothetical protein
MRNMGVLYQQKQNWYCRSLKILRKDKKELKKENNKIQKKKLF